MRSTCLIFILLLFLLGAPTFAAPNVANLPPSLRAFFGTMRGDFFLPRHLISQQVMLGLSIPDPLPKQRSVTVPDGMTLISGCRLHSCDEKAAVVVDGRGNVSGAALINFRCRPSGMCWKEPILTIFLRHNDDKVATTFRDWAEIKGVNKSSEVILVGKK